jgi:predicted TIM-barrel fold metal-dependent hydrolase
MHPDFTDIEDEVERLVDADFRGIKLQPDWQGFYPNEERAFRLYEAVEGRLAVLFHVERTAAQTGTPRSTIGGLLEVRQRFPGLTLIVAHMGGHQCWDRMQDVITGAGVYMDTSNCPEDQLGDERMLEIIRKQSARRVLFASDLPFADPKTIADRLMRMPLPHDEKEDIAWANAERLLARTPAAPTP